MSIYTLSAILNILTWRPAAVLTAQMSRNLVALTTNAT